MLQTTSTERRAAGGDRGGDRPRSSGSVEMRPSQGEVRNRRKSRSRQSEETEQFFELKSTS